MEPLSALAIATTTTPYLEQSLTVSRSLYDYFKETKNSPELSKELRRESMLVSDVLDDLHKALASNVRSVSSSKVGRYADIVDEFALTMTEMTARIQVKSKEAKKRLKWPFTAKENQEYLGKFERYTSTFMLALQIVQGYIYSVWLINRQTKHSGSDGPQCPCCSEFSSNEPKYSRF
jgi:hypothetical protein